MTFRTKRSSASIAAPLSYLLGQRAPHATLQKVYLVLEFGSNHPHHLGSLLTQDSPSSVLNDYLTTAFDRVIYGRLCADYPLIFSPQYSKKVSAITQYIPVFARAIQQIITRSTTDGEQPQTQQQQPMHTQLQQSGSPAGSIALSNIRAMGIRMKILRPPPSPEVLETSDPIADNGDTKADIRRDLVIAFYYSAKCTHKSAKSRCTATTSTQVPSTSQRPQQQQQYLLPYEENADCWTVPVG
ncbi:hypothetical protein BX666DRAFT_1978362 [Dichotomocladium elegans]|nr:hypothetical protein BX666DRAFT_1978362 [Dichotomocladium elegans]